MLNLEKIPRLRIAFLPTPLEEAVHLRRKIGGPRLFIKRDDQTGLALGGNKARKLEFLMADAQRREATVVLTAGAPQSNHARMTAAACAKWGIKCYLLLGGLKELRRRQGNLLLDELLNAQIEFTDEENNEQLLLMMKEKAREMKKRGEIPYIIPVGGSNPLGALGYVAAMRELLTQTKKLGLKVDYLVHATSSGGTQAGLLLANKALKTDIKIMGISVSPDKKTAANRVVKIARGAAKLLNLDISITPKDVLVFDEYIGKGYAIPSREGSEAIRLLAQAEGIILDPVYTGKAMSGLIDLIKEKRFDSKETVVFFHTGGYPGLFAIPPYPAK
ncbi:MAG: D-cysteine desulfhydrase family protein [Candidatus Edwardsbacteria bacterium]